VRHAALLLAALALVAGCGGGGPETTPAAVKEALEGRLISKKLSFEWVYCLRTKLSFEGRPIVRCNVNFGDPHIVIYCATLDDGTLVTNRERPALRCGRTVTATRPPGREGLFE
jgi:hypothetical protein